MGDEFNDVAAPKQVKKITYRNNTTVSKDGSILVG